MYYSCQVVEEHSASCVHHRIKDEESHNAARESLADDFVEMFAFCDEGDWARVLAKPPRALSCNRCGSGYQDDPKVYRVFFRLAEMVRSRNLTASQREPGTGICHTSTGPKIDQRVCRQMRRGGRPGREPRHVQTFDEGNGFTIALEDRTLDRVRGQGRC